MYVFSCCDGTCGQYEPWKLGLRRAPTSSHLAACERGNGDCVARVNHRESRSFETRSRCAPKSRFRGPRFNDEIPLDNLSRHNGSSRLAGVTNVAIRGCFWSPLIETCRTAPPVPLRHGSRCSNVKCRGGHHTRRMPSSPFQPTANRTQTLGARHDPGDNDSTAR